MSRSRTEENERRAAQKAPWWKTDPETAREHPQPRRGQSCPQCHMADLAFDSLFRLHCPVCGYVAECGAFT
ncbi:MAG: hypothetical protein R3300_10030 [Candidatus Promineifilaceae bacterium]|nr:hypothetical protein [Candidatus Promineifilaceae bacterium]